MKAPLNPDHGSSDSFTAPMEPLSIEAQHAEMVLKLAKPGAEILRELTPHQADLWHAATGVFTEAGEIGDAIKAHVIYQKPLNLENLVEELGDIEFYLARLRQMLQITRHETLVQNLRKLAQRYPNYQYSNNRAQTRADKATKACRLCLIEFVSGDEVELEGGLMLHQACAEAVRRAGGKFGEALKTNFPHLSGEAEKPKTNQQ